MQITKESAVAFTENETADILAGLQIIAFIETAGDAHVKIERAAGDDEELVELAAMLQGHLLGLRNIAIVLGARRGVNIYSEWQRVKARYENKAGA